MQIFLERLSSTEWKQMLREACKMNKLPVSQATTLTVNKLKCLHERFEDSRSLRSEKLTTTWLQNQLKAFTWVVLGVSGLENKPISHFEKDQWDWLEKIFSPKTPQFLKYEVKRTLTLRDVKNKDWSEQQNQLLTRLVLESQGDEDKIPWNDIAHIMFESSEGGFFRVAKHCRQHWLNYLDPEKNRGKWTTEEETYLLEQVLHNGKKWSEYAAFLRRTQHTVKNHYNSLITRQQKHIPQTSKQEKVIASLLNKIGSRQTIYPEELSSQKPEQPVEVEKVTHKHKKQEKHRTKKVQKRKESSVEIEPQIEQAHNEVQQVNMNEVHQVNMNEVHQAGGNQWPIDNMNHFVRQQDPSMKNQGQSAIYPLISPSWGFSPNNGTPFLSSPVSGMYFYTFRNYFDNFTNILNRVVPPEDNPPQPQ